MHQLALLARHFLRRELAATMVEYALMLALIALACFAAIGVMGTQLNGFFTAFAARMP